MAGIETKFQVPDVPAEWNEITRRIIRAGMEVHTRLGPVGLESVFERAMAIELRELGLMVRQQVPVPLLYRGNAIGELVLDLLVNELVVVELKAIEVIADVHFAQLASYLRQGDFPLGLLINFRVAHLRDGVHRRINGRSSKFPRPATSASPSVSSAPLRMS